MATAKNAKIQFEAGQSIVAFEAAIDSGDNTVFNPSGTVMSGAIAPVIRPNGVVTGLNLLSTNVAADIVSVAACKVNSKGVVYDVSALTVDISADRPATNVACVISIIVDDTGALGSVVGIDGLTTAFSETRGAAGGPPLIPVDAVELGQIRVASSAAAVIATSEIFQNGQYTERSDFPVYTVNNIGVGASSTIAGKTNAFVEFSEALPLIHTGPATKNIYIEYYVPSFADLARTSNFVPAETSHSISSEEFYGGSISSSSESLGQASFTALLDDGVNDGLISKKNTNITLKAFPDRAKSGYLLTQGIMGIARSFPIGNQINASVTLTPEQASAEFTS